MFSSYVHHIEHIWIQAFLGYTIQQQHSISGHHDTHIVGRSHDTTTAQNDEPHQCDEEVTMMMYDDGTSLLTTVDDLLFTTTQLSITLQRYQTSI